MSARQQRNSQGTPSNYTGSNYQRDSHQQRQPIQNSYGEEGFHDRESIIGYYQQGRNRYSQQSVSPVVRSPVSSTSRYSGVSGYLQQGQQNRNSQQNQHLSSLVSQTNNLQLHDQSLEEAPENFYRDFQVDWRFGQPVKSASANYSNDFAKIPSNAPSSRHSTHSTLYGASTVAPASSARTSHYQEGTAIAGGETLAEQGEEYQRIAVEGEEEEEEEEEEDVTEEEEEDEEADDTSMEESESWITAFCSLPGHEYFCEVSEEFIEDDFNLTGLSSMVPNYKAALEMILDVEPSSDEEDDLDDDDEEEMYRRKTRPRANSDVSQIETSAELLYGLIHQRFITSRAGIQVMYDKYMVNHFGHCPRVYCNYARVLPCGYSDLPGVETVKLFCPSCLDIYVPPNSRFQKVDGAFFGTTFPSLFLMTFPELDISGTRDTSGFRNKRKEKTNPAQARIINGTLEPYLAPGLGKGHMYDMKIYGFKVSERSKSGPRMKWLRDKPDDVLELDEAAKAQLQLGLVRESEDEEMDDEDEEGHGMRRR